jgi:hypothetical protein
MLMDPEAPPLGTSAYARRTKRLIKLIDFIRSYGYVIVFITSNLLLIRHCLGVKALSTYRVSQLLVTNRLAKVLWLRLYRECVSRILTLGDELV